MVARQYYFRRQLICNTAVGRTINLRQYSKVAAIPVRFIEIINRVLLSTTPLCFWHIGIIELLVGA